MHENLLGRQARISEHVRPGFTSMLLIGVLAVVYNCTDRLVETLIRVLLLKTLFTHLIQRLRPAADSLFYPLRITGIASPRGLDFLI